jgi:Hypervirulence associated proteins TUDOR domain
MTQRFNHGHRVTWITPEGRTLGRIAKRLTRTTYIRGDKAATPDDPEYIVKYGRHRKSAPRP